MKKTLITTFSIALFFATQAQTTEKVEKDGDSERNKTELKVSKNKVIVPVNTSKINTSQSKKAVLNLDESREVKTIKVKTVEPVAVERKSEKAIEKQELQVK